MPGPARSKGCYRCREKKTKCDEVRPECNRYKYLGFQCPGYRPENELIFLNMSEWVEQRASGAHPRRGRGNNGARKNRKLTGDGDHIYRTATIEEITTIKPEEQESSLAVSRHTPIFRPPVNTDWRDPALCRFFSDFTMDTNDLKVNPGFLHNLSRLFNQAGTHDELLVKAMYSGEKPVRTVWETHADALAMIPRSRGTASQFTDARINGITRASHRVVMFRNLLKRVAPGPETEMMEAAMDPNVTWSQILSVQRCRQLLQANVYFKSIILLQTLLALTIKVTFHTHLSYAFVEMELLRLKTEKCIHEMVNHISFSVAEVLGNLEEEIWNTRTPQDGKAAAGYTSMWPLNIALSVKTLSQEQRAYIFRQLNFIHSRLGLRQALGIKER
ncbi:hypothetical protein N431DRAFT_558297 [Stipitochalara longipes BDJ]|nr:hypothetical protein N431DRAFT_558297 [Stipitochalara longipes BDJ]